MKLQKQIEMWFPLPDDPEKARVLIAHLSPGDMQDIADAAYKLIPEFTRDGKDAKVTADYNQKAERDLILKRSVKDWEKFFDVDGTELKCTAENLSKIARLVDGFIDFVAESRKQLADKVAEDKKALEKN